LVKTEDEKKNFNVIFLPSFYGLALFEHFSFSFFLLHNETLLFSKCISNQRCIGKYGLLVGSSLVFETFFLFAFKAMDTLLKNHFSFGRKKQLKKCIPDFF